MGDERRHRRGYLDGGGERAGDRVLGGVLHRRRQPERVAVAGHVGDRERPGGDGAGLVEHDRVDRTRRLEHLRPADQDAQLGAAAGADQERHRRRQAERARARDDQHRDGVRERHVGRGAGREPGDQRARGDHEHDRDEHRGDAIGEALHGGLPRLRLLDQAADPCDRRVGADAGRLDHQPPADVHGRARHGVVRLHLDRDALAGQQRAVDGGVSLAHDAVGRDQLTRPDHEHVADRELRERYAVLAIVVDHGHVADATGRKRAQRTRCPAFRARLEIPADQDEQRHAGGHLEVEVVGPRRHEQRDQRPAERRRDPDRDQRVHGRRAVSQAPQRRPVDRPAAPPDHRQRQPQRDPVARGRVQPVRHPVGDDGHRQHSGDDHPQAEPVVRCGRIVRQPGRVAGRGDGGDQIAGRDPPGVVVDGGPLEREVHGCVDAVERVQAPLDPRHAPGARHPLDGQVEMGARRVGHASHCTVPP